MSSSSATSYKRAKTRRGRKYLAERAPKIHENPKQILYMHGSKCSQILQDIFRDLNALTAPQSRIFSRKRDLRPMDDESQLEALSNKLDVSLFAIGSSNKKRPNCITLARTFNHRMLDMCELLVTDFKPMHKFKDVEKPAAMNKPAMVFQGNAWTQDINMRSLKTLLIDFFRGPVVESVNLAGIDRALVFSVEEDRIVMTQYRIDYKKSGLRLPLVELTECGPFLDMKLGRPRWAAPELMKEALKQPKQLKTKKVKNVEYTGLGDKLGRVHMERQDLSQLQTRKMKALKKGKRSADDAGAAERPETDE